MHSESLIKRHFLFFFHDFLMYNFKLTFVSKPKNQKINIDGVKSPREVRLGSNFRYIFAFFKFNSGSGPRRGAGTGRRGGGRRDKKKIDCQSSCHARRKSYWKREWWASHTRQQPIRGNLIFALYEAAVRSFQPFRILSEQLAFLPCSTFPSKYPIYLATPCPSTNCRRSVAHPCSCRSRTSPPRDGNRVKQLQDHIIYGSVREFIHASHYWHVRRARPAN